MVRPAPSAARGASTAAAPRPARSFPDLLREWRQRRRLSQLDLACRADVSAKHLSFLETGRAAPSREMVLRLAEQLDVPLRQRNALLGAAGYAPLYPERPLDDPSLAAARRAVDLVLKGHLPYPALAVDRHWNLVAANDAVAPLLAGADPALLRPPANVLRLSLHPAGLAPRIVNLTAWRSHLLQRLGHQVEVSADPALAGLLNELLAYPPPGRGAGDADPNADHSSDEPAADVEYGGIVVPLRLRFGGTVLNLFSTTTVFGTPVDVTLAELALEAFYPADDATAEALRGGPGVE
jgi:transcriptional regulator with XRE-family HTH domain